MFSILVSALYTELIPLPSIASNAVLTLVIRKGSSGTLSGGTFVYFAGIQWKLTFTPTTLNELYAVEVTDADGNVVFSQTYKADGTVTTPSAPAETDYSFDITTNTGKVRALIGDTNSASVLLSDAKINAFLTMRSSDLFASAALALYAIAASKSLLAKKKSAGNYSEDLSAIAKELRETAARYEEISMSTPAEAQAEVFLTDFNYNEVLRSKVFRGESD